MVGGVVGGWDMSGWGWDMSGWGWDMSGWGWDMSGWGWDMSGWGWDMSGWGVGHEWLGVGHEWLVGGGGGGGGGGHPFTWQHCCIVFTKRHTQYDNFQTSFKYVGDGGREKEARAWSFTVLHIK